MRDVTTPQSPQRPQPAQPAAYPQQSYPAHPGYDPRAGQIPPQWAPAGYPQQVPGRHAATVAPRNGLGIAALCLGIVGVLFGLVPFTGFVAFALGAVGVILGLVGFSRARKRVATNKKTALFGTAASVGAIALGIWGMVIVFSGLNQLAEDLNAIPSAAGPVSTGASTAGPADIVTPASAGPHTYQLEITGTAKRIMVSYGTDSAMSSSTDYQSLPWRKSVESTGDYSYASVSAVSSGPGSVTCTITDTATGQVVDTETANSLDESKYSSANVSCNSMGY